MIARVGTAAFMTNATTAMGFATFMVTYSDVLREFGLIASLNIMSLYVLAILLIPIFFSYQKPPKAAPYEPPGPSLAGPHHRVHREHGDEPASGGVPGHGRVPGHRPGGLQPPAEREPHRGRSPANSRVLTDLRFFERNFNGVMPLEVLVDTKKGGRCAMPP